MIKNYSVFYNDLKVGDMFLNPDKKMCFRYDSLWISNGFSLNPISLPLNDSIFIPKNYVFNGLFGVFYDSFPDSWGRLLLKRISGPENDESDFLKYTNKLSSGALTYTPTEYTNIKDVEVDKLDRLAKEAEAILNNDSYGLDLFISNVFSSGGARPKINIMIDGKYYLVKFNTHLDGAQAGRREYEYSLCAKRCGIKMKDTKLLGSKISDGYFATERFDFNDDGSKIHMVSVAGMLEFDYNSPAIDYLDLIKLTRYLTNDSKEDLLQIFRQMCFNVFAHNLDDHGKNFAFLYDEKKRRWYLSPAFDITYSNTYYNEHTTSVNGKGKDITDNDLLMVGLTMDLNRKNFVVPINDACLSNQRY